MDYRKPEVQSVGEAIEIVTQYAQIKAVGPTEGVPPYIHNTPAYDLDE